MDHMLGSLSAYGLRARPELPAGPHAGDLEMDAVEAGAGGDVERLVVVAAPGAVGGDFRDFDRAQMLSRGREDLNAAGAGAVDVALRIDPHAVRHARLLTLHLREDS